MNIAGTEMWTLQEVADHLGVDYHTVVVYKTKGKLPEPDLMVSRSPLWKPETMQGWKLDQRGRGWRAGITGSHEQRKAAQAYAA